MEAVFKKEDMEFCKVDVPSGYQQGQTHAGIAYIPEGFLGYTSYLTLSPYANYNLDWENPCLYYANNRPDGRPPIEFTPHVSNPLQTRPVEQGYSPWNSDPDILFDADKLVVLNRISGSSIGDNINMQTITSLTSVSDSSDLYNKKQIGGGYYRTEILSPSILKVNNKYRIYHLNSTGGSVNVRNIDMVIMEGDTLNTASMKKLRSGSVVGWNYEAWHWQVFVHNSKFYAVICATDWSAVGKNKPLRLFFAKSDDGFDFRIFKKPLISYESYRSAAYVRNDGLFVLYATVTDKALIQEPVYAVDGREVVLCTKPFEQLLTELSNEEW